MTNPIRELVVKVSVDADTKGFDDLNKAQDHTGTKSVALGNIIADVTSKLADAAIAAAQYGLSLIKDIVSGSIEAADAIAKNADQLAVNNEQLQRLSGAAKRSGTDVSQLDGGIQSLTKGLGDAALKGTGPVVDAFGTLGLEVEEVSSLLESGDIEDALGLIGDAFNNTADSAEKNAALLQIFGGAGARLRPLLEQGSEGIRALGDDVRNVISAEDLDQFEALADANLRVEEEVEALKFQIAAGLAPSLELIAGRVSDFIDENSELITQDLPEFLAQVGETLIQITEFVIEAIEAWREFRPQVEPLIELLGERLADAFVEISELLADNVEDLVELIETVVWLVETGNELLDWGESMTTQLEKDWPRAFGIAKSVVDALISPIDTVRNVAQELFEWLESIVPQIGEIAKLLDRIRVSVGLGEQAQSVQGDDEGPAPVFAGGGAVVPLSATRQVRDARDLRRARRAAPAADAAAPGRPRRGGRGGGGAAKGPTVEELIAGVAGMGSGGGGPSRVGGGAALAGTNLITVDNSITINNGDVTVTLELPTAAAVASSPAEFVSAIEPVVRGVLADQNRMDFDRARARRNVGGG